MCPVRCQVPTQYRNLKSDLSNPGAPLPSEPWATMVLPEALESELQPRLTRLSCPRHEHPSAAQLNPRCPSEEEEGRCLMERPILSSAPQPGQ